MKKYSTYIAILAFGLLLGWWFFGSSSSNQTHPDHEEATAKNEFWTCSMHPQIMQPEAGDCPICGMDLIVAEANADGLSIHQFKLTNNAMALANIQTSVVGQNAEQSNSLKITGKIVENEETTETLSAHYNGRVEKLFINFVGEKIKKGQAVAEVYSAELVNAQQELLTAYALRAEQPNLYKAVQNKFKNWEIHQNQLDEIIRTGVIKNSFTLYAHASGTVSEIFVNQGGHIANGMPIFKLAKLQSVWAVFDLYERQLGQFSVGQKIAVGTQAFPNKTYQASIAFIQPALDSKTRTVAMRVVLQNKDELLKPGMFVEGVALLDTSKNTEISIPTTAVLWTGKRSVVYLKTAAETPVFELREVQLGLQSGNSYPVISGLNTGDEIVTNGTFTVDAAAQLQGKKSMMNQQENSAAVNSKDSPIAGLERKEVSAEFQQQLAVAFNAYIQLKDALVLDKAVTAVEAEPFLNALSKVSMNLLTSSSDHTQWMGYAKHMKTAANLILNSDDLGVQRNEFRQLSNNMINAVQLFGIQKKVYKQFCPMANNDKGAYWLSLDAAVKNPYYGAAMLNCGEVKEIIN
ncbi:hypothetical protein GCM10011416_00770 [Polaribacter pacificus]|uniref:Membrane fusion protein, Cu(I)/Ag(I) efflux system n=1 Tax=Polaribacter pacificus TaxID=1775173 RepID=A0A917HT15_9FLAO|nr:efflux RND transporter periplasmic adaptor subunit [Polaribacter pacificus]GGG88356.1 hypothetical protein GCM10011416_00770 [Polaribacter pacificus]